MNAKQRKSEKDKRRAIIEARALAQEAEGRAANAADVARSGAEGIERAAKAEHEMDVMAARIVDGIQWIAAALKGETPPEGADGVFCDLAKRVALLYAADAAAHEEMFHARMKVAKLEADLADMPKLRRRMQAKEADCELANRACKAAQSRIAQLEADLDLRIGRVKPQPAALEPTETTDNKMDAL
jgi:hypothetical protein